MNSITYLQVIEVKQTLNFIINSASCIITNRYCLIILEITMKFI